ncbi:MAG: AAC(3) family N-acetyltransferase [Polyangiales bacterium]
MEPLLPSMIRADLERALGSSEIVVLHSAPRSIGRVVGGIESVANVLLEVLGERTLVFPTFTTQRTDPSTWAFPSVPREMWAAIREEIPLFDPRTSPPRGMGSLVNLLWPRAERSFHPVESIAAIGPRAREIVSRHPIDDPMGPRSPWARLYDHDARVVLLGVTLSSCSILHHAERMAEVPYLEATAYAMPLAPLEPGGERIWVEVESGNNCSEGFPNLEPRLRIASLLEETNVGMARTLVSSARSLVDAAKAVLADEPYSLLCDLPECPFCPAARGDTPPAER